MESQLRINYYKVLASTHEERLCYSKGRMWLEDRNQKCTKVNVKLSALSKFRLAERILRLTPRLGFTINGEFYFSMHGSLLHINKSKMTVHTVYQFRSGMNNPLMICKRKQDQKEYVYWGEYWSNPTHDKVKVIRFDGNVVAEVCSISGIKHVHSIIWDQYRDCFWITTGDSDEESKILKASESFDCLETVFSGQQIYRTCALFPVENGIIYATDSPLSSNSLLFSGIKKDQFLEPVFVTTMPGPCIFSLKYHDNFYFSTSVEPNPNQFFIKYWLSRRISPGNTDKKSHVICVTKDFEKTELFCADKDIHNMFFFQFGNIQLSYDACADAMAAYCTSLKKYDGRTIYLSVSGERY